MNSIIKKGTALVIGTSWMQYTLNYIKTDCEHQLQKRQRLQDNTISINIYEQKSKILK